MRSINWEGNYTQYTTPKLPVGPPRTAVIDDGSTPIVSRMALCSYVANIRSPDVRLIFTADLFARPRSYPGETYSRGWVPLWHEKFRYFVHRSLNFTGVKSEKFGIDFSPQSPRSRPSFEMTQYISEIDDLPTWCILPEFGKVRSTQLREN